MMALRVGLTGGLGSGKSTVAAMLAQLGAHVISADELGRALMEPGTDVFRAIVKQFGTTVLTAQGRLDRPALAQLAFGADRVEELNAIVHPATITAQGLASDAIVAQDSSAVIVVESALIFETRWGNGWRDRFDRMVLVTAPEQLKIARFIGRSTDPSLIAASQIAALEAEARRRLARMIPDEEKAPQCDFVLVNDGSLAELRIKVELLWKALRTAAG